jgi:hypothetical protein
MPRRPAAKSVETLKHDADKRKNIPTAELQSVLNDAEHKPVETRYARQGAACAGSPPFFTSLPGYRICTTPGITAGNRWNTSGS